MKKILSLTLMLALLVCGVMAFSSCGDKTQTVFKPEGEIKGTLKLGFDASFPPYGYLDADTNQYAGFDIDLAKVVCNKIGYELQLVPIDWNAKDQLLNSGAINCIWNGFTMSPERADAYTWTPAYSDSSIVVLVKGTAITTLADLAGKKVTVQTGSSGETALYKTEDGEIVKDANGVKVLSDLAQTFKDGTFTSVQDYNTAFTSLDSGATDAIVIDIGVAQRLIKGKTGYAILDESIASEQYGIGFKLGDTATRDLIWNTIQGLEKSEIKAIADKYEIADSIIIDE